MRQKDGVIYMERTISVMLGKGSVNHNSRVFQAKNTDPERSDQSVCHVIGSKRELDTRVSLKQALAAKDSKAAQDRTRSGINRCSLRRQNWPS